MSKNKWRMPWYDWLVFLVPSLLIVGLGVESALGPTGIEYRDFRAVAHWFDPVFFQYNLVMALLAVLVVPSLALAYIQSMTNRKERQLLREAPAARHAEILERIRQRASFGTYRGSICLTTTIVLLGICILLLFKPLPSANGGVDFSLGGNMLIMGVYAELFGRDPGAYYTHLVRSLVAFQFGFLGAYIYFIGSVARAFFTVDLTPHTFIDGSIRMIVASILALILSFAVYAVSPETAGQSPGLLPVVSFFFGFYPKRAAVAIERIVLKIVQSLPGDSYRALPLSMLAGMSYAHELRLEREGYDNIENLSTADTVDLAIRTCFTYGQLEQWKDQAWLAVHLREDYPEFVRRTGITGGSELRRFLTASDAAQANGLEQLVAAVTADPAATASWRTRLTALKALLAADRPEPAGAAPSGRPAAGQVFHEPLESRPPAKEPGPVRGGDA